MQRIILKKIVMSAFAFMLAHQVSANLLINPTRVVLSPSDRTADVTLINTSTTTNTYRIGWVEKKAKEAGGYDDLSPEAAANFPIASSMIRYSPKQVTLKAGERQTIKLAIRRPQGLANGEYRSHLLFKALPPADAEQAEGRDNSTSLKINILLTFAIPVVVQQGSLNYQVTLNNASISYNPANKSGAVNLNMARTGTSSVIGNIDAYWTPKGGKEQIIAKLGDYNLWPELQQAIPPLIWTGTNFAKTDGQLRIVYEGTNDFRGKVFFDKTFNIQGSMIKTTN
jgi:fimbrial chaperone protein